MTVNQEKICLFHSKIGFKIKIAPKNDVFRVFLCLELIDIMLF